MERIRATFRATILAFRAAVTPMLTWSSWLADVGMLSTLAGCANTLFSDAKAAAVTCTIINPELRPPSLTKNGGNPESCGLTSLSVRRSLMAPSSASAMVAKSAVCATGCPWKFPPERTSPDSAKIIGLSVALFISIRRTCSA